MARSAAAGAAVVGADAADDCTVAGAVEDNVVGTAARLLPLELQPVATTAAPRTTRARLFIAPFTLGVGCRRRQPLRVSDPPTRAAAPWDDTA